MHDKNIFTDTSRNLHFNGTIVLCKNKHFMILVNPMDNLRNCSNQCNHVMSVTMEVAVFFRNNKLWSVVILRK